MTADKEQEDDNLTYEKKRGGLTTASLSIHHIMLILVLNRYTCN